MRPAVPLFPPDFSLLQEITENSDVISGRYLAEPVTPSLVKPRIVDDVTADHLNIGRKLIYDVRSRYVTNGLYNVVSHVHATAGEARIRGEMLKRWVQQNQHPMVSKYDYDPRKVRVTAKGTILYGVASCDELSALCFTLASALKLSRPVRRWISSTMTHAGMDIGDERVGDAVRICAWSIFPDASLADESAYQLGRVLDEHPPNTPLPAELAFDAEQILTERITDDNVADFLVKKNQSLGRHALPPIGPELVKHYLKSEITNAGDYGTRGLFEQHFGVKKPVTVYWSAKYGLQFFNVPPTDYQPHRNLEQFFRVEPALKTGLGYSFAKGITICSPAVRINRLTGKK